MREIKAQQITDVVKNLCIKANCYLPGDVKKRIEDLRAAEPWPQAQEVLDRIIENYNIAEEGCRPICQDTGLACVFVKVDHYESPPAMMYTVFSSCEDILSYSVWVHLTNFKPPRAD